MIKKPDPRYLKISLYFFMTGAGLLILWKILSGNWSIANAIGSALLFLWKAVATVAAGLSIAYILLPAVESFENLLKKIFKKHQNIKVIKLVSIALVYLLLLGLLVLAAVFIIPGVVKNMVDFVINVPEYYKIIQEWYWRNVRDSDFLNNSYIRNVMEKAGQKLNTNMNQWIIDMVSGTAGFAYRFIVSILKALLAIILSIYFLTSRHSLKDGLIKASNAYMGDKKTSSVRTFLRSVDWVFGRYISAKLLQMLIIFIVTQIIFLLMRVPYSTLFSALIALTNMVPFIGPLIGLIPPVLISLLQSPIKALWVFLAIEGVQMLDEYFVQPHLVGDKMGLSPFWVLVSVIVGGGLFGLVGIILAVPVAAVIRILIHQSIKRIQKKKEAEEFSISTK